MALQTKPRAAFVHSRSLARRLAAVVSAELAWLESRRAGADLALFHEFLPPPGGGGHQFLRGLVGELSRRGLVVESNRISGATPACLFNSFNFDFRRLRRFARPDVRMVHRVDGPIWVYRGFDDGTDRRIVELNRELAAATVFQSSWSLEKHAALGLELRNPVVITNAPDPAIFYPPAGRAPLGRRKVRLVSTGWSDNPRKGADVLAWLDARLDRERYELTFVGHAPVELEWTRVLGPVASAELAAILREQDVYLAASVDDPCSNSLLEALACGLPVLYRRSGGHPELVGEAGLGFDAPEEALERLDRLVAGLEERRAAIRVPRLEDVADRYLEVLSA
jgi:glycosyltransferase involved in cell wall biosynthesis